MCEMRDLPCRGRAGRHLQGPGRRVALLGLCQHVAGHAIGERGLADAGTAGKQPGVVQAPAGKGLRQHRLRRRMAEQRACLARVRELAQAVGLGQGLGLRHVLDPRRARHHCIPGGSMRRSTCSQTSAATFSGGAVPSITLQRRGSPLAMSRKPWRRRSWNSRSRFS